MKICSKCRINKNFTDFYRNKSSKDGYQNYCKTCNDLVNKKYCDSNREKVLQIYQNYHKTHKEQEVENYQEWYKKNKNKKVQYCKEYYQNNIEYMKDKTKRWVKDNYQQKLIYSQNRRAMLLNAPGKFTKENFDIKYQEQDGKCFYCNEEKKLTIDHKIPLSRGGSNWPENIVLACLTCNCSKNDKTFEEFYKIYNKGVLT
jgi:5-methylcytosine-specific restriction endonuclease McrA